VAGSRALRVCAPPSTAEFLLLFIPALALLFPDLSEINFLGLGIKRQVDEVEDVQTKATKAAEGLTKAFGDQYVLLSGDVRKVQAEGELDRERLRRALAALTQVQARVNQLEREIGA
jgi:hypothetical protein